jgi:hypothetical protein
MGWQSEKEELIFWSFLKEYDKIKTEYGEKYILGFYLF